MSLYISKSAMDVFLDRQINNCHGYHGNKKEIYKEALLAVKSFVKTENCIDAVAVVRCKDCIHSETQIDHLYCGSLCAVVPADWWCANGKKEVR